MSPPVDGSLVGADADELAAGAAALRAAADDLDRQAVTLSATLTTAAWLGDGADSFRDRWTHVHRSRLTSTATTLRTAAASLDLDAAEQRSASAVSDRCAVATPPPVGRTHPGDDGASLGGPSGGLDGIGDLLESLGVDPRNVAALGDGLLTRLDPDVAGRLVAILGDSRFRAVLDASDHLVDVGGFVVDVISDSVDHPDLSFDERIVHAIADASIRLGVERGVTEGASLAAGAIVATVFPGIGAAALPIVRATIEAVIGQVADMAIDAVDDAYGVVDAAADLVTDGYRLIKEQLGPLLAAAGVATEVAGDAIDLTVDGARITVDVATEIATAFGDELDDLGDAARDLIGSQRDGLVRGAEAAAGGIADGAGAVVDGAGAVGGAIVDGVGSVIGGWP